LATDPALAGILATQPVINGKYDCLSHVGGAGSFSIIYKARRTADGAPVALKFSLENPDSYRKSSFHREGRVMGTVLKGEDKFVQLAGPPETLKVELLVASPAPIRISWERDFIPYEWMSGGDVSQFCTPVSDSADLIFKLALFDQMCACVSRAHFKGCYHRDLKPPNFLMDRGVVRLGDMGTARIKSLPPLLPAYSAPVGDLRYAAPEVLAGLDLPDGFIGEADFYSLGAILFELLTSQQLSTFSIGDLSRLYDFMNHLRAVPPASRQVVFEGFVSGVGPKIPNLRALAPDLPRCAFPLLDEILTLLAHFDFRKRARDLTRVRRLLRSCRLVVKHHARYASMLERRRATRRRNGS
jgi:serine/threonine protein kinase